MTGPVGYWLVLLWPLVMGVVAAGEVVVDVGTLGSNREELGQKACFQQSRWKYDFQRDTVERAEEGLTVEKFGTVVPRK